MAQRKELETAELAFLQKEYRKNPVLFKPGTFIEDAKTLEPFGIHIPGKASFPTGYPKLWPQDFIVEEILSDGSLTRPYTGDLTSTSENQTGETVFATLVKCGLSTIEALEEIAAASSSGDPHIGFAGIKDKDAITAQRISIRQKPLTEIMTLRSPYFFLKDITTGKGFIDKGNLSGNRFTILVRTADPIDSEQLLAHIQKISREGFYNFFYLQRFGTPRLINYYWGMLILKGQYERAVRSIIGEPTERELPFFHAYRKELGTHFGDWQWIKNKIAPLPLMLREEMKMVSYLEKNPQDFRGALQQIPEQITLWVFAFSSLLFNMKISSYLADGQEPPEKLPFFLDRNKVSWEPYQKMLTELDMYPADFAYIRPYPQITLRPRSANTKESVKMHSAKIIPEGVVLEFSLSKGAYATTFLSHFFNLISGAPPTNLPDSIIDLKAELEEEPLKDTLQYFQKVAYSKKENRFGGFGLG